MILPANLGEVAGTIDEALASYEGPTPGHRVLKVLKDLGLEVYSTQTIERTEKSRERLAERVKSLNKDKRDILGDFGDALIKTREYVQPKVNLPALEGWSWYDVMKKHLPRVLQEVMNQEARQEAIAAEDDNEVENHELMFPSDASSAGVEAVEDAKLELEGFLVRLNDLVDEGDELKYMNPERALDNGDPNLQDVLFWVFKGYKQERDQARSVIPSIIAAADNTINDMSGAYQAYERKIAVDAEEKSKRAKANSSMVGWQKVKEAIENA